PAAMANLLGDLWQNGEPNWPAVFETPNVKLHLYGKAEAKRGRKMGHLTAMADSAELSMSAVKKSRRSLR
nr:5-(carboxyamino)imidazole ribonucleotide synthase [Blastocatellia bacterium]